MSYQESLARLLQERSIPVEADVVPDRGAVEDDLASLAGWLGALEQDTLDAIDEITAENGIQAGLADVGIVSSLGGILAGFDSQPSAISISVSAQMIQDASSHAAAEEPIS